MKTRRDSAEYTAGHTFSALLDKLGEKIHLSQSQTQIASASNSMSHSNASPVTYQSQPDVDINTYSTGPRASNYSSYIEDGTPSTSLHSQNSSTQVSVQSNAQDEECSLYSYSYSASDEYYSSNASYSYYSDSSDEGDMEVLDQMPTIDHSERSLPKKILKTIIRENPHILSKLRVTLKQHSSSTNTPNYQQEPPEYKFSITEMRQIKEIGENLVAAAQNALKVEARRQRETSNRLSRPKQSKEINARSSPHHRLSEGRTKDQAKTSKRRRPAVVLDVPQLDKGIITTETNNVYGSSAISTDLSSSSIGQSTDQHLLTKSSTQDFSINSEQVDDPVIISHIQRDYLKVPQPLIQEHSPHRLSIPGTRSSTFSTIEQRTRNNIPERSVPSIATPQELLASVALIGSIPDTYSATDTTSKQHAASQTGSMNSSKQRSGDSSAGLGIGSRSKPLSSSALELSGELPEPASRLIMTKSPALAQSQPMIDLTLTTTAPQQGNTSAAYQSKSIVSLSQQLRTTRIQSDQTIKELKNKINTLESKLKDEKQRNASTSKQLRDIRERKRILEGQLKKKIEESDMATWEAQKKALKMNMSLMRTISAMKVDQSSSKAQRKHSHRQATKVPSHMLARRENNYLQSTLPLLNGDTPLVEIAPPVANPSISKEDSIPPAIKLHDSTEQSIDVNEILICSNKRTTQPSTSNDLNKLFVDTCNRTIRDALADVYSPNSSTFPVVTSADPPPVHIEATPPPQPLSLSHETDSPIDRQKLLASDTSPDVAIDKTKSQNVKKTNDAAQSYTLSIETQLFQKNLHKNVSMLLGNQATPDIKTNNLRPPPAPQQENRARSIKRYGECVALFLSPSPTRYPADAIEIANLIVSISTNISTIPGIQSNEQQSMYDNLRLVREFIESPNLSVFNYPLFSAKLMAAMFCAYGSTSFSVYNTIIYRISDLLLAELVSPTDTTDGSSLYEIECRLYIHILNIIRGVCPLIVGTTTYQPQPGENSLQIVTSAFNSLNEFISSANVFLEDTALYLVISTSAEVLFTTTLTRDINPLSLSTTPVVSRSTGEHRQGCVTISLLEEKDIIVVIAKTVVLLCNQLLTEPSCTSDKSETRYYQNHSLCSISSLLYCISILIQHNELSVENSALLTQLRRKITDTIPSLNLIPRA